MNVEQRRQYFQSLRSQSNDEVTCESRHMAWRSDIGAVGVGVGLVGIHVLMGLGIAQNALGEYLPSGGLMWGLVIGYGKISTEALQRSNITIAELKRRNLEIRFSGLQNFALGLIKNTPNQ